ncbi:MAG: type I restriction enzyme HsdR N-terminal domain-containing protein [Candidatus Cryptobacteroides sp.]
MGDSADIVFDPLRKREVLLTPEEQVRQWFIGVLSQRMKVPMHMMMSEVGFRLAGKQFRADIIIYDRTAAPLAVVECKRPEVALDRDVLEQAVRYNMVLNVRYMFITNGLKTFVFRRGDEGDGGYVMVDKVPSWEEMLAPSGRETK